MTPASPTPPAAAPAAASPPRPPRPARPSNPPRDVAFPIPPVHNASSGSPGTDGRLFGAGLSVSGTQVSDIARTISAAIDATSDALLATLCDLVRINTANPCSGGKTLGSEKPGQLYLQPRFARLRARTTLQSVPADVFDCAGIIGPRPRDFTDRPNLLADFCAAFETITGQKPGVQTMNGWSDASYVPLLAGCPAVNLGCSAAGAAHAPDEYVEEETLIRNTKVLTLYLAQTLAEGARS